MAAHTDIRLLALPTLESLAADHDRRPDDGRELVIVRLEDADGAWGWGECAALTRPTYTAEWARGAFAVLSDGDPDRAAHPMAAAAIEMAQLDLELRRAGQSLSSWLGVSRRLVPAGATVGLMTIPALVDRIDRLVDSGFGRVKMKIAPGHDVDPVQAVIERHPDLDVQADANGSFLPKQMETLRSVVGVGVSVIEQPFGPTGEEAVKATAELVNDGQATVVADEAIAGLADARRLRRAGALGGVSIKAPRLGGIRAAVELLRWCTDHDVPATAGGMLESGLGRHALAAVAALPGFTITGDLSPAHRWLAVDPWPDLIMSQGSILVPHEPGVAPQPDLDLLHEHTIRRTVRPR